MANKGKSIAAALTKAAQKAAAVAAKNAKKSVTKKATGSARTVKTTVRNTSKKTAAQQKKASGKRATSLPELFPAYKAPAPPKLSALKKVQTDINAKTAGQGRANAKSSGRAMVNALNGADLGKKLGAAYKNPVNAQYLPLSSDFRVSSVFGVDRVTHRHSGIDLAVAEGTKVAAVKTGTVSFAGWGNGYGYRVVIDHPDGTQTTYNHLSDIGVKVGETVLAGRPIALSGNTGNSTGPHLHFEVKQDGRYVDPELYFDFGNGLKAADSAYTSQMSTVSGSGKTSSGSKSSSKSGSKSYASSSSSSGKKKSAASLPKMDFTAPKLNTPALPKAAAPTITAYRAASRSIPDYFRSPLTTLVPGYYTTKRKTTTKSLF